jgi:hypothetical protein
VFAAFIVGCVTSQVVAPLLVPAVRAGTTPPRWEYLCIDISHAKTVETWANKAGAEGWELTAASGRGDSARPVWCFKRPLP